MHQLGPRFRHRPNGRFRRSDGEAPDRQATLTLPAPDETTTVGPRFHPHDRPAINAPERAGRNGDASHRSGDQHRDRLLSVVVPTRNEADNVDPLLDALDSVVGHIDLEVLFVDDSDDGTPEAIRRRMLHGRLPIRLLHRAPGDRADGLGGAVAAGLARARGRWACVMDADLQHPPALIPRLLAEGASSGADVVVASRYCGSGGASRLGALRGAISRGSGNLARLLFPRRLRGVSDPMSGFFLVQLKRLNVAQLRPHGFKILLEILARHRASVREIPYEFGLRHAGESKASLREGLRFVRHLARLRLGWSTRLARFAAVGASGVVVNTGVLFGLSLLWGLHYLAWAFVATQVSILWNYGLSEIWVFRGRAGDRRMLARLMPFLALNNLAMAFSGPLLFVLASLFGLEYLLANLISIGLLTIARFAAADTWIWGEEPRGEVLAAEGAHPARPVEALAVS